MYSIAFISFACPGNLAVGLFPILATDRKFKITISACCSCRPVIIITRAMGS